MSNPLIRIHNTETNEVIDREMNKEEFEQWQLNQESFAKVKAEEEVKANKRFALLAKLGITEEEAALLLE